LVLAKSLVSALVSPEPGYLNLAARILRLMISVYVRRSEEG
jgi:hypothetical protein